MTTINTTGRPGYMYDEATTTWYAISGRVSTSANYVWTGAQQFDNNMLVNGGITATLKFNSFLNPAARSSAITSPSTGLISFIQQDSSGNTINKFQYWNGSAWSDINSVAYSSSSPSSPSAGNVWVDSSTKVQYVYNGTAWVNLANAVFASSAPSNPSSGTLWINSTSLDMYVYNGTAWVQTGGSGANPFFLAGL